MKYQGSCHCGDIRFSFKHDQPIDAGLRCNCSICIRKGALMSNFIIPPDEFDIEIKEGGELGLYEFDNKVAHHFFCKRCGIYPFHQTLRVADHYRVNLGCIESIDPFTLKEEVFDGKKL